MKTIASSLVLLALVASSLRTPRIRESTSPGTIASARPPRWTT